MIQQKPTPMPSLYYREYNEEYRVWRSDWMGDQFEILNKEDFEALEHWCGRFGISITPQHD